MAEERQDETGTKKEDTVASADKKDDDADKAGDDKEQPVAKKEDDGGDEKKRAGVKLLPRCQFPGWGRAAICITMIAALICVVGVLYIGYKVHDVAAPDIPTAVEIAVEVVKQMPTTPPTITPAPITPAPTPTPTTPAPTTPGQSPSQADIDKALKDLGL